MGHPADGESDFEKIKMALGGLPSISNVDDILAAFGLTDLPSAQRYGILFGCLTFFCTVCAVISLLVLGGSFARMKEQAANGGEPVLPDAVAVRQGRPLLLERLLELREWMMTNNYPGRYDQKQNGKHTRLTQMLVNVAPSREIAKDVPDLIDEADKKKKGLISSLLGSGNKKATTDTKKPKKSKEEIRKYIPEGYEENYVHAYRRCQDKPGGAILSGLPEARFEAYARAYAGCGTKTSTDYRRSYARLYETVSCKSHGTEKFFSEHFESRPQDLVGRTIRLEVLDADRHGEELFEVTSGKPTECQKSYDPNLVWGFLDYGPFQNKEEMIKSPVFVRQDNEAAFAIVEAVSERVLGIVILTNDDPKNLSIQLEIPIVNPNSEGTQEEIESTFLLMDRLFALGYRRIQMAVDSQDTIGKKLPGRLGYTQEGMLPKHRIIKEANRDSNIYGMLNSDWNKGARKYLYKKLHGASYQKVDEMQNIKEGELENQNNQLQEKKEMEEQEKQEEKKEVDKKNA
mmetsp:Transcript_42181/g.61853  ORF Transcript_42181/g.61853 Transcript_42181/m.61853 type:complete len:516 (-) Transcript_42181:253-1800(-)|eukprot:CAMPEP_0195516294 /NCGR_PEP_ID=MMETSP0794_2-20130614/7065_1 /TAXON_ID=515487 /ORGANISM="Stephanopyxis turris, Strain CCMP 815" /LENGTH=515 /DNA_ID=CAMNT_0040644853 /DNA_START=167 /DNA_END=1714 /DNA_ORIENTATION=+